MKWCWWSIGPVVDTVRFECGAREAVNMVVAPMLDVALTVTALEPVLVTI